MINENWMKIGFQQKNPRTDFRAGGHLSLLCLIYICQFYPHDFKEMVKTTAEKEDVMWLTAISSISLTHHLVAYLRLNKEPVAPNLLKLLAGR